DEGPLVTAIPAVMDGLGVVLLRTVDRGQLAAWVERHGVRAAIHGAVTARTAPRAYRLAAHAVQSAPEFAWTRRSVLADGDLEVVALTTGHADADPARAALSVLGPLAEDADALRTLDTVLHTGGAAQAAQHLHLHA